MRKITPKHQDKQGSFAKMALLVILLFLLFWKDKVKTWFCAPCDCENKPEEENPVFSPDFNPDLQKQEMEVNKEVFERENDSNVLELSKAEITQKYFPDTDIVKLSSVFNR